MTRYRSTEVAELLQNQLRYRTLENLVANSPRPEGMKKRIYCILIGETEFVSSRVADDIACLCGRPDWLHLLTPY